MLSILFMDGEEDHMLDAIILSILAPKCRFVLRFRILPFRAHLLLPFIIIVDTVAWTRGARQAGSILEVDGSATC